MSKERRAIERLNVPTDGDYNLNFRYGQRAGTDALPQGMAARIDAPAYMHVTIPLYDAVTGGVHHSLQRDGTEVLTDADYAGHVATMARLVAGDPLFPVLLEGLKVFTIIG